MSPTVDSAPPKRFAVNTNHHLDPSVQKIRNQQLLMQSNGQPPKGGSFSISPSLFATPEPKRGQSKFDAMRIRDDATLNEFQVPPMQQISVQVSGSKPLGGGRKPPSQLSNSRFQTEVKRNGRMLSNDSTYTGNAQYLSNQRVRKKSNFRDNSFY